jgi:hypothetical protein
MNGKESARESQGQPTPVGPESSLNGQPHDNGQPPPFTVGKTKGRTFWQGKGPRNLDFTGCVHSSGQPPQYGFEMIPRKKGEKRHKLTVPFDRALAYVNAYERHRAETEASPERKPQPKPEEESAEGESLPEILHDNKKFNILRDECIEVLEKDKRIYKRGDALVAIRELEDEDKVGPFKVGDGEGQLRKARGAVAVSPLSEDELLGYLLEDANILIEVKDKNGEPYTKNWTPTSQLLQLILVKKTYPRMRDLVTIADAPHVDVKGEIVTTAGYRPDTGTLLTRSFDVSNVPNEPSQKDAYNAAAAILERVDKFPFATISDKVVWLSAVLTSIQFHVIGGKAPGIAFVGNKFGTGKDLLVTLIGAMARGGPIASYAYPPHDEEAKKLIFAMALQGIGFLHFDNAPNGGSYGGPGLDMCLTASTIGGRILGESRVVDDVPLNMNIYVSGNNISPQADAHRRWLPVNLVSEEENPHLRADLTEDDYGIVDSFLADRDELLGHALTILKAHALAGRPRHGEPKLGSFEKWDDMIRSAIFYATNLDCIETQQKAAESSESYLQKHGLMEGFRKLTNAMTKGYTSQEIVTTVNFDPMFNNDPNEDLRQLLRSLPKDKSQTISQALGIALRSIRNDNIGGWKFVTEATRGGLAVWKVKRV